MSIDDFRVKMNRMGQQKVPFLFVIDFEMENPLIIPLTDINARDILYDINGRTNAATPAETNHSISLQKFPLSPEEYRSRFDAVFHHLEYGNSFLVNLTIKTPIRTSLTLNDIFFRSKAKYKLLFYDQFLVFSPEIFVQVSDGLIRCYPMKGTIDASIPGAAQKILNDHKELSEHVTIVDLIRNDLSQIATDVKVSRFRYIDEIRTDSKTLLQISSEIIGQYDFRVNMGLGDMLVRLLPAGSVSGAPKPRTLEIIRAVEKEKRGYYTGVFGVFDGERLDSGVMIRFIEQQNGEFFYRSGGGITTQSDVMAEYREAIDKVYVPLT